MWQCIKNPDANWVHREAHEGMSARLAAEAGMNLRADFESSESQKRAAIEYADLRKTLAWKHCLFLNPNCPFHSGGSHGEQSINSKNGVYRYLSSEISRKSLTPLIKKC